MNTTMDEIKQDLADDTASLKQLKVKVDGLENLTNQIKAQLDTLIIAGSPSVSDLNALRDGLLSAKAQIQAESDSVDETVSNDTPVTSTTTPVLTAAPAEVPQPTEPAAPVAPGGPSSTETVVGKPDADPAAQSGPR